MRIIVEMANRTQHHLDVGPQTKEAFMEALRHDGVAFISVDKPDGRTITLMTAQISSIEER